MTIVDQEYSSKGTKMTFVDQEYSSKGNLLDIPCAFIGSMLLPVRTWIDVGVCPHRAPQEFASCHQFICSVFLIKHLYRTLPPPGIISHLQSIDGTQPKLLLSNTITSPWNRWRWWPKKNPIKHHLIKKLKKLRTIIEKNATTTQTRTDSDVHPFSREPRRGARRPLCSSRHRVGHPKA